MLSRWLLTKFLSSELRRKLIKSLLLVGYTIQWTPLMSTPPFQVYRVGNSLSQKGKSWVTTGVVLPSRVVSLVIKRPPHFAFKVR